MVNNYKKKANVTWVFVIVIISIVSFLVYLSFYTNLIPSVVSNTDDLMCRSFISVKSTPHFKFGEFFYELNQKCKVDSKIELDLKEKEKSFQELAIKMSRCWYRYGEGKQDFLENIDSTGNWCFLCGEIEFKDNSESINYGEFIEWTKNNNYNESISYFDYFNVIHTQVSGDEVRELRKEYEIFLSEGDLGAESSQMLYVLGQQISKLDELRLKQLEANNNMYVVYRYDRIQKDFEQQMEDATKGMVVGIAGGIVVSIIAEGVAEAALMGTIGAAAGTVVPGAGTAAGGLFGGVVGFSKGVVKGIWKTGKSVDKVLKISKTMKKVGKYVKKSKTIKKLDKFDEIMDILSIGKKEDIAKLVSKLDHSDDFKEPLEGVVKMMDDLKIDDLNNLDDIKNFNLDHLDNVIELYNKQKVRIEKATKAGEIRRRQNRINEHLGSMGKSQLNLEKINDLDKNVFLILEKAKDQKKIGNKADLLPEEAATMSDYLRTIVILGSSGTLGGVIGIEYNTNYNQYVDILTQEQYYRLCGTQYYNDIK